jgi:hypothetical protein
MTVGYEDAIGWIVRERASQNGWPPSDVCKVSGWLVVRMTAALFGRNVREVALDVIDGAAMRLRTEGEA